MLTAQRRRRAMHGAKICSSATADETVSRILAPSQDSGQPLHSPPLEHLSTSLKKTFAWIMRERRCGAAMQVRIMAAACTGVADPPTGAVGAAVTPGMPLTTQDPDRRTQWRDGGKRFSAGQKSPRRWSKRKRRGGRERDDEDLVLMRGSGCCCCYC